MRLSLFELDNDGDGDDDGFCVLDDVDDEERVFSIDTPTLILESGFQLRIRDRISDSSSDSRVRFLVVIPSI